MSTSRRKFMKDGAIVAVAASVPLGLAEKTLANVISTPTVTKGLDLNKSTFAALLNSEFVITKGRAKVGLKLVEVSDLAKPANHKSRSDKEGFSLLFQGHSSMPLQQNTYAMSHKALGSFSFLMTPMMNRNDNALYYEVVVNRLYP